MVFKSDKQRKKVMALLKGGTKSSVNPQIVGRIKVSKPKVSSPQVLSKKFKGGFSDGLFNSENFQDYIKSGFVFGYIGSFSRKPGFDRIIEKGLRDEGLNDEGIATWLTSTNGRHIMDSVENKTTKAQFSKDMKKFFSQG